MHMIFNGISVNRRQVGEIGHCDVPKKIELAFEIGFSASETKFFKTTIKNDTFSHKLMLILVNINGNRYSPDRYVL